MAELLVDFITSLDGYASAEGWPGFWGLEGPEYLGWLEQAPERDLTTLMGASRTFDGRLQLLEYLPTVLNGPPSGITPRREPRQTVSRPRTVHGRRR